MDVNQSDFRRQLLPILKNIANAKFVAFDLEMSGIYTRPRYGPGDRSQDIGKPALQEQYEEMRSAAELYQIVQLGITCVEEDRDKGFYLARPYNFNLNPLSADGVEIKLERNFTFSSSACDFLRKNNFDFGRIFSQGVPYLSQKEQREIETEHRERAGRVANIPDITVPANDAPNLQFVRNAREEIAEWLAKPKPEVDHVNIGHDGNPMEVPLNAFQRRLIYQLVRKEFPTCRTYPRHQQTFMRVEKVDLEKEDQFQKRKTDQFNYLVCQQIGLRWIFEALSGGDLSGLDPKYLSIDENEEDVRDPVKKAKVLRLELKTVVEALRIKRPIIIGHNLFMDLGFLYSTFVGTLPQDVRHFQAEIHERFPLVFDTKYIATEGIDSNARQGLKDLLEPYKEVHEPLLLLHESHSSYGTSFGKAHEAGFDSWMTAELFIKLSAKLYAKRKHKLPESDESDDSSDYLSLDEDTGGAALVNNSNSSEESLLDHLPPEWHAKQLNNRFAALAVVRPNEYGSEETVKADGVQQWLPKISHAFWDNYINKLRVNASEGGVCDLEDGYER